jgi:hypothetical protein
VARTPPGLWEWLTEPIENRIEYIKYWKPEHEVPTRLRLLKIIPSYRIRPLIEARKAYEMAEQSAKKTYDSTLQGFAKSDTEWDTIVNTAERAYELTVASALDAWDAVRRSFDMEALHRELCPDCPWDGQTIFPKAKR